MGKGLGIYYLLSAFIFGISGTLISVLLRIELYSSGNRIISPENQNFYNISITLHGFIMIFFLIMPGLFGGFGNYFVPIFQGSPEVVYPRVNNFSILILFLSYLFIILSFISEFGGGTGWTLYPPLSTSFMSLSPSSLAILIFGLLISGISSCLTSLNFWITILNLRSYCLTLKTMPLFPWALLITAAMLLLTLPVLSGALLMVLADLHSNTLFFDSVFGEIRNLTTFCLLPLVNNGFSLSFFFLSFLSFLWIGAQFPQEKFLSYARILTLYYYFLL